MASCPTGNGTTYITPEGLQYELYCDYNFNGEDLPATDATSYADCIASCDGYTMDKGEANGANCVAAVFGAADPNGESITSVHPVKESRPDAIIGNACWLKYQITDVQTGGNEVYAARRVEYQFNGPAVYTNFIAPSPSPSPTPAKPSPTSSPSPSPVTNDT